MPPPPARPRSLACLAGFALAALGALPRVCQAGFRQPAPLPEWGIQLGASWRAALVPPFWTEARDRLTVDAAAHWRVIPSLALWLELDALRHDRLARGSRTGAGDLRLGTTVRAFPGADGGLVEGGASWWVKLPNADDELELGTDETDIGGLLHLALRPGPVLVHLAGGAELRGDPARSQTQDPVALLRAGLGTDLGVVEPALDWELQLATDRQEPRSELALALRRRCPFFVALQGSAGLFPASPSWSAHLRLGYLAGCDIPSEVP